MPPRRSTLTCLLCTLTVALTACPEPELGQWQVVAEALPEAVLSVSGRTATDVWAVGTDKGQGPLVLHFDGTGWTRVSTGTRGDLWWVHVLPDGEVWMAGASATVLRGDGHTFTRVPTPGLARHTLFGLWASSASDVWVAGSGASRNGFVWRYDGATWHEVPLPADLPALEYADAPGLFKVWGDGQGTVWAAGGRGVLLRSTGGGAFTRVPTGTDATLFTVHGSGERVVAVGGGSNGVLGELAGPTSAFAEHTPEGLPLLQGVYLTADGTGWATGARGTVVRRARDGRWTPVEHGLALRAESLHAVWVDPEGGVWAGGGNVLSSGLDGGVLVHLGRAQVARYTPPPPETPPAATCPTAQVDPAEGRSIARRWDEQVLAAIRRDVPRPGVHARNLFHLSAAMYDAWAAYDTTATGLFVTEKATSADVERAREEAISYAAFRVLSHRYAAERAVGADVSQACFRALMQKLGFPPEDTTTTGDGPRALGNRIGAAILAAGADDGANEGANYADTTGFAAVNTPLVVDTPGAELAEPSKWQPLVLAQAVTQNGIPLGSGAQGYIGAQWGEVRPFALQRPAPDALYFEPGPVPAFGPEMREWVVDVVRRSAQLDPAAPDTLDISPGAYGNNPLGTNDGTGHPVNPVTGQPYAPQQVRLGDFARVMAEFWADGPRSETPPGHWNVLANAVADAPSLVRRLEGQGEVLSPLEWDVKVYLALNGAVHDAAIAAWELKRRFVCARPLSLIRYMGGRGQASDTAAPAYHPDGLPLVPGLIELITPESAAPGGRHAHLARFVGQVAVRSWRGEPGDRKAQVGGVGWVRAVDWMPYQLRTFVTPAFPGFVSGHSTFSRAAAEVLARLTGSPYFPGGLGEYVAPKDTTLTFEVGPSTEVRLQWATYSDAADQAGQSRLWGGIHIGPDDFTGRRIGSEVGQAAAARALALFGGAP